MTLTRVYVLLLLTDKLFKFYPKVNLNFSSVLFAIFALSFVSVNVPLLNHLVSLSCYMLLCFLYLHRWNFLTEICMG